MAWLTPASSRIFVTGLFAVTACPPFGPFFSELGIVRAGLENGNGWVVAAFLSCLLLAFLGMTRLVFAIVDGRPRKADRENAARWHESMGVIAPPLVLLVASLWLGLATPPILREVWADAVRILFANP